MQTVLPREEAVEGVISKVLESQEACDRLNEVFYEHLENYQEINDDGDRHFAEVLLQAYKNGDVSALLLELCGGSMFDLLRDAYLIPKKFHGKSGENPVLLTDLLSLVTRFIALVFRRSIAIDLLSILGNDFHILLAKIGRAHV